MAQKKTTDYVAEIRQYSTTQLVTLLYDIKAGNPIHGWPSGRAFEYLILRGFEIEGAEIVWPYTVTFGGRIIEQIDGAVYYQGLACLIEAKDYGTTINIEPVAKLSNQLSRRPLGTMGMVFARTDYTETMKDLTRMMNPLRILLWEYAELEEALQNQAMCKATQLKYRGAVEHGAPDFSVKGRLK